MLAQAPELPARLATIKDMLGDWHGVGDIGTDHGLLPISLAAATRGSQGPIVATDCASGPLDRASQAIEAAGLSGHIDLRLGYGLTPLAYGEVDVVVIAGMGHRTIAGILSDDIKRGSPVLSGVRRLVLQANGLDSLLRAWLIDTGFELVREQIVCERGHFYIVDVVGVPAERRHQPLVSWLIGEMGALGVAASTVLEVGPLLLAERNAELGSMLAAEVGRLATALTQAQASEGERAAAGVDRLSQRLREMEVMIGWVSRG